jgi:hypothetical protein
LHSRFDRLPFSVLQVVAHIPSPLLSASQVVPTSGCALLSVFSADFMLWDGSVHRFGLVAGEE